MLRINEKTDTYRHQNWILWFCKVVKFPTKTIIGNVKIPKNFRFLQEKLSKDYLKYELNKKGIEILEMSLQPTIFQIARDNFTYFKRDELNIMRGLKGQNKKKS
uniref:Uncharacterized protein n=1 Tax=Cacopsylla melanoneura TaxID=428564 RepID=A0A8D8X8H9_9HEMI